MKRLPIILLRSALAISALFTVQQAYSQINIPLHKGLRPTTGWSQKLPTTHLSDNIDSATNSYRERLLQRHKELANDNFDAQSTSYSEFRNIPRSSEMISKFMTLDSVGKLSYANLEKGDKQYVDSLISKVKNRYANIETYKTAALLNENSRYQPLISGGVNNIVQNGQSAIGSINIGLQYRISKFRTGKTDKSGQRIDPHYVYVAWNASTAKSADSSNIFKAILFPELAKSDFIIGWHRDVIKGDFVFGWMAEVSLNTYKDSTNQKLFRSESFTGGYQVTFLGNLPNVNLPAGLKVLAYGNVINIDPKYNEGLNALINNTPIHNTFFNLGLRVQAEVNGANLFFNGKYILNPHGDVTSPDLVRFVYTVGALVGL